MARARIVVDTNVLVSRLSLPHSLPAQALRRAEREARLLISEATMYELADVLDCSKFDRYISRENRRSFLRRLGQIAELVPIVQVVRECHDPKDDKFLEVALNGRADVIITGDGRLLEMDRWREIAILSPGKFLKK